MRDKLVRFFYNRLFWLVPLWYGLTMNLTRWRRWPHLPSFMAPREIAAELEWGSRWRPDPLKGNFDVLMDPRKMQSKIDRGDTEFGDCDDHALYWCTALLQSGLADRAWLSTIWYVLPGQKSTGHVVCVYEKDNGRLWCDYREPQHTATEWGWAHAVAAAYGKQAIAAGMVEVQLRHNGAPKFRFRTTRSTSELTRG